MSLLDGSPVFIVGAQRSGTTWLQRLLCAHPRIVGGQESHLFSGYLAPLWERWQVERGMRENGGRAIGLACYLTEEEFIDECRGLVERVFRRLGQAKPGAELLVEKTPDHGLCLPLIHRLFPSAIVLHVLRDGRDVAASQLHAHRQGWGRGWAPTTARDAARRWVDWVTTIRRDIGAFPRSQTIRYEDLARKGPDVLAELFAALGVLLPLDEVARIIEHSGFDAQRSGAGPESLVLTGDGDRVSEPEGFFRRGLPGAWERDLSGREQQAVHAIAGPLLRELGYPVPSSVGRAGFLSRLPTVSRVLRGVARRITGGRTTRFVVDRWEGRGN
jgi:Sulfotransferase family